VFLPGARSIQETIGALSSTARELDFDRFPLYGALPLKEQIRAISSSKDRRRVIVATNIAETSLTVEGVTTVIDSGLVKQMRVDPSSGLNRLEEVRVALDSATQRAGRAGRVREGRALRLWTHVDEQFMSAATEAEINRVDLAPVILDVLAWSSADPHSFDWFEEPPARAIDAALGLLERLGALDMERGGFALTEVGEALAAMPTHPRQGRMLIEGAANGVRHEVAAAAAILAEEDFVSRASREQPPANCDLWARVEVLEDVAREVADWISEDSIVLHTCGSISSEVLSQQGIRAHVGSLHPLLAIADPHEALDAMGRCTWTAEGDDLAVETAQRVLSPLGVEAMAIKPSAKALYHASAVTSAGLLVSLMDAAFAMASEAGLSAQQARQMLLPLARSCIDNLEKMSSAEALTGPVARGDEATLARHRKSLRSHPDLLEVYEVLTRRGVAMLDD